jgi:predicted dehydrogenase
MANTPLRFGILGCANIARAFVHDVAASPQLQVVAVASRDARKAAAFAADFKLPRHHGSYQALLDDPGLDAVYLPLPNSLHAEWAIRAAEAGKHVLCEKPMALDRAQAQAMFDAARRHGVMLLEAFPYWFQPQTGHLLRLLAEGAIGQVRSVQASFGFMLPKPAGNIRMDPALGGGALLDAGSYPLSLIRLVMGCAPQQVWGHARWADSGVDIATMATLRYADGRMAQLSCAMDGGGHRQALIVGTDGVLETEYLNHTAARVGDNAQAYLPSQMRLRRGPGMRTPFELVSSPVGSGFRFAAEAFAAKVATGDHAALARAAEASLDNADTLAAIARSARLGQAVTL